MKIDEFDFTSPVGSFRANGFGLYDMGGNVAEWCEDWYNAQQTFRVLRGGSWASQEIGVLAVLLRSSYRKLSKPAYRGDVYGFRCVLVVSGG